MVTVWLFKLIFHLVLWRCWLGKRGGSRPENML